MVIEMLLNNDIQIFFGSNDLNFPKKRSNYVHYFFN